MIEHLSPSEALDLLDAWSFDEAQRSAVESLHAAMLGPAADLDPPRRWEATLLELREAFASGYLILHVERMSAGAPGAAPVQPSKPEKPPKSVGPSSAWIEVQLEDEGGAVVADEPVLIVDPEGAAHHLMTNERGLTRLETIAPGTCEVSFPRIDGREWCRRGGAFTSGSGDVATVHRVQPRECMARIAYLHAFRSGATLHEHPRNAELRRRRPSPDLLWPGDLVHVLVRDDRADVAATGARHPYRVRTAHRWLRVVLHDSDGDPLREVEVTVQMAGGRAVATPTSAEGLLEILISPAVDRAEIVAPGHRWAVAIADVRPVTLSPDEGRTGARRRLANLGSHSQPGGSATRAGVAGGEAAGEAGGRPDDFDASIWDYQLRRNLEPTGRLDEGTVAAVVAEYGH